MSNEHHDLAALDGAVDLGIDALHGMAPDEVLGDVPFDQWEKPEVSAEEQGAQMVGRDVLLQAITSQCFEGYASLLEAGLRFCAMSSRAGLPVELNAEERRLLRKVAVECHGSLALPLCADRAVVFQFLRGSEREPRKIGRRLSLLAYALNRGYVIRAVLPSMEEIGTLWGLKAENKRSAVCEALMKLRAEVLKMWNVTHVRAESFKFWFEKSPDAVAVYEQVQMGNTNRQAKQQREESGTDAGAEVREILHGIPLKPEFRGLTPKQLRKRLDEIRLAAEEGRAHV